MILMREVRRGWKMGLMLLMWMEMERRSEGVRRGILRMMGMGMVLYKWWVYISLIIVNIIVNDF